MASILSSNNLRIVAENSELLIRVYRFSGSKKHLDLLGGGLGMSVSIRSFAIERFHVTSQSHENHTGGHFGVQLNGDLVCCMMRVQNAAQTWQLMDLPHKYVRYRYPVHVICET